MFFVAVHGGEEVVFTLVFFYDGHGFGLDFNRVVLACLVAGIFQSAVYELLFLCLEKIGSIDAYEVKHQHEHVPVFGLPRGNFCVADFTECLHVHGALERGLFFEVEAFEGAGRDDALVYGMVENGADGAEENAAGILAVGLGHGGVQFAQPLLVKVGNGLVFNVGVDLSDPFEGPVVDDACALGFSRGHELFIEWDEEVLGLLRLLDLFRKGPLHDGVAKIVGIVESIARVVQ